MLFRSWAAAVLAAMLACAPAWAEPVNVQLRVEGATATIFEGPVTTDGKQIDKGDGPHPCDGTNGGANPSPGPTATSALDDGSLAGGFTWDGSWAAPSFEDFLINAIGPDASDSSRFWGIAVNFTPLSVGGCQKRVQTGDEVLFGYDFFSKLHLLKIDGPATARPGQPLQVTVTDGQNGSPIANAGIVGGAGAVTGPDGSATVSFDSPGLKLLKAERADSIRSDALVVCVPEPDKSDCAGAANPSVPGAAALPIVGLVPGVAGAGGTVRDSKAPTASISAPRNGRRYRRGPRVLRGRASDEQSGVSEVKLALRRHVRGTNCRWWSGRRERFVGSHCRKAFFFAVGDDADWSYLLPRRLPPGHYVLDVKAFDRSSNGNQQFARGVGRAVFDVLTRSDRQVGPPSLRGGARPTASRRGGTGRHLLRRASAAERGARVEVMVAGTTRILAGPRTLRARPTRMRASGRRCLVAPSTPLAALAATLHRARVSYRVRDFGRCAAASARSSGQLFVERIGRDRNRGQNGWFYKVNHRAGTTGAADPAGIPGGRLRAGDHVLWFYCVFDQAAGSCQQSLELVPSSGIGRAGETLRLRVLGYRNEGSGTPVAGAMVTLGTSTATTDAAGRAEVRLPSPGRHELRALKAGAVAAFPLSVRVL